MNREYAADLYAGLALELNAALYDDPDAAAAIRRAEAALDEIHDAAARESVERMIAVALRRARRRAAGDDPAPRRPTATTDAFMTAVAALPRRLVYRALMRAVHPDAGGDLRMAQTITAAYAAEERK